MAKPDEEIEIAVDGRHIACTLVSPAPLVPGVLFVHGWGGSQEKYLARAREIAALGCVCLTFNLRGHAETEPQHETVTREDNLRDLMAAYDVLVRHPLVDKNSIAVVGSSYGAYLAAILTERRPVRWLALRVPALYRDEDWSPQAAAEEVRAGGLTAARHQPGREPGARSVRRLPERCADRGVGARRHHRASGDRQRHGGVRECPLAHLSGDRGSRPRSL